jgi:hypothetical protein
MPRVLSGPRSRRDIRCLYGIKVIWHGRFVAPDYTWPYDVTRPCKFCDHLTRWRAYSNATPRRTGQVHAVCHVCWTDHFAIVLKR